MKTQKIISKTQNYFLKKFHKNIFWIVNDTSIVLLVVKENRQYITTICQIAYNHYLFFQPEYYFVNSQKIIFLKEEREKETNEKFCKQNNSNLS